MRDSRRRIPSELGAAHCFPSSEGGLYKDYLGFANESALQNNSFNFLSRSCLTHYTANDFIYLVLLLKWRPFLFNSIFSLSAGDHDCSLVCVCAGVNRRDYRYTILPRGRPASETVTILCREEQTLFEDDKSLLMTSLQTDATLQIHI